MDLPRKQRKIIAFEISDYFSRYLSYLVDLIFILSIVTIILVYIFNESAIIYQFPFYYLYTHNSIHELILNSNGLDFAIFYLFISFIYHALSSYFGFSLGSVVMNLRINNVSDFQTEEKRSRKKRFILKLKNSALRSVFLTIPLFPLFDNLFAKEGKKLTDNYLKIVVIHPLRLKEIRIHSLMHHNTNHGLSKISHKMISYDEFLEYFDLREVKGNSEIALRRKRAVRTKNRRKYTNYANAHMLKIASTVNSREFFLSNLLDMSENDLTNKEDSIWKVKRRYRFDFFYASSLLYSIPFLVAIIVGWHVTNGQTFSVPPPLTADKFVPPGSLSQVQQNIFNQNFPIDLRFLILGGITLFFLPYLGIYSSVYLPNLEIANVLHTKYWYYIFYAVFPHLFIESFGYVLGIMSGLYLSKLLVDILASYGRGTSLNKFFSLSYYNISRFGLMLILSVVLILSSSYVEAYFTSYIMNHFYFVH